MACPPACAAHFARFRIARRARIKISGAATVPGHLPVAGTGLSAGRFKAGPLSRPIRAPFGARPDHEPPLVDPLVGHLAPRYDIGVL